MLSYRAIFDIADHDAFAGIVEPGVFRWLGERKGLDLDKLGPAWSSGKSAKANLVSLPARKGGGEIRRITLLESTGWSTAITIERESKLPLRFQIDVQTPDPKTPSLVPAIVRELLSQATARDSLCRLTDSPRVMLPDDLDELEAAINDSNRRAVIFVAGSDRALPTGAWRALVGDITANTVGMGTAIVLNPQLTDLMATKHGPNGYEVPAGTIRTFLPGAQLDRAHEARRHRILGTDRLVADRSDYLARLMAYVARQTATEAPLDSRAREADRAINRLQVADLLGLGKATASGSSTSTKLTPSGKPAGAKGPVSREPDPRVPESTPPPSRSRVPAEADPDAALAKRLLATVRRALTRSNKPQPLDDAALNQIESVLSEDPAQRLDRAKQVAARLAELEEERDRLEVKYQVSNEELENLELENAEMQQALTQREAEVQRLRVLVQASGRPEDAWSEGVSDPRLNFPTSFADVYRRRAEFSVLEFTCDPSGAEALDEGHRSTSRAGELWQALLAVDDYGRAKANGHFSGSLYEYIKKCPTGYHPLRPDRYAASESETVATGRKSSRERTFPVPTDIDASGSLLMLTHLRIGRERNAARAYLHDATGNLGRIIVGYIGPHLDVKSTN